MTGFSVLAESAGRLPVVGRTDRQPSPATRIVPSALAARKAPAEGLACSTTCKPGRGGLTTIPAICAFNDVISSCSSTVWKRFARRSIRAPIMLPSSGVSSPFPIAARMSPNASAHSVELDSGRVLKLTGTPFRTGTARFTRRDSAAVSFSFVPASNRAVKMSGSFSASWRSKRSRAVFVRRGAWAPLAAQLVELVRVKVGSDEEMASADEELEEMTERRFEKLALPRLRSGGPTSASFGKIAAAA